MARDLGGSTREEIVVDLGSQPLAHLPWAVGLRSGAMFAAGPPFHLRLLYEES